MALAALIVSIAAALVAGGSALYARRVAVVEEERRLDETRPQFDAEHDGPLGEAETVLLTYTGPEECLDGVHLIVRSPQTPDGFALHDEQGDSVTELSLGHLLLGQTVSVRVKRLSDQSGGTLRLEARCHRQKRKWSVLIECEIRRIPRVHGF